MIVRIRIVSDSLDVEKGQCLQKTPEWLKNA